MSELANRIARLSPEQRELLQRRLQARGQGEVPLLPRIMGSAGASPSQAASSSLPPLSFAQQRLWFLDQLLPGNTLHNLPGAVRLRGPFDPDALAAAFRALAQRHDTLRTSFATDGAGPVQVIAPELPALPLISLDLRYLSVTERPPHLRQLLADEARQPFSLESGPLWRAKVLRLDEEDHVVALTVHHIISDAWSVGVLLAELAFLYDACHTGGTAVLPPLPIQYADYAVWQRQRLQGPVLGMLLDFWQGRLEAFPTTLDLPTDRPRPLVPGFQGGSVVICWPAKIVEAVRQLACEEKATPFMVLLSAWQALLGRLSGQEHFTIGCPVAGRDRPETEALIGFFVNALVLRADLGGDPTFRELLARVREEALEAFAHQELPFEKLVEALQPGRNLGRTPLFQTTFALHNTPRPIPRLAGLTWELMEMQPAAVQFDLSLSLRESEDAFRGSLDYNAEVFEARTAERLVQMLEVLLRGALSAPERRLSDLPLLTEQDRGQLLAWSRGPQLQAPDGCLHQRIEAQARQRPEALAVACGIQRLSYGELEEQAQRLAEHLRIVGAGPGTRVAVCLERSVQWAVALLGVLKTGAAYVPLDPNYPAQRLDFLLSDCGAAILLCSRQIAPFSDASQKRLQGLLERFCEASLKTFTVLDLDSPDENLPPASATQTQADQPAYVIYTSGSTGQPKGVVVPQRCLTSLLDWSNQTYPLSPTDRFLQTASFSFDISAWELFFPLCSGATVVLAEEADRQDGAALVRLLSQEHITAAFLTPGLLRLLVQAPGLEECSSLGRLFCGGEALSGELVGRLTQRLPGVQLINLYGPTEATIMATHHPCTLADTSRVVVSLGKPLAGVSAYVLDSKDQLAPVGVPGELFLGGSGVAWGYLNRPARTAERFLPDPFAGGHGRLYRTGDWVRWLADGTLEFLGRLDQQLKIRGFRIEPGEVEAVLLRHPAVREAVVVARESGAGDLRLVAYVTASTEAPEPRELRQYLLAQLPDYMVPAVFVHLPSLPRNANGKIDRNLLPAPVGRESLAAAGWVEPRTELEKQIAAVWQEVLGVSRVGANDNFFDLGGYSLLLVQVHARLRQNGHADLPLIALFQFPTVSALARHLDKGTDSPESSEPGTNRAEVRRQFLERRSSRRPASPEETGRGE